MLIKRHNKPRSLQENKIKETTQNLAPEQWHFKVNLRLQYLENYRVKFWTVTKD